VFVSALVPSFVAKVDHMAAQSAKIEAGHVYLPKSAAWLGEFLTELLSFPNGRHDDQVDSVSQFLRWLQDAYRLCHIAE
jgi:predicted phage terminase large subunit-like protein